MLIMFSSFAFYFLYDWKVGYPEKNYIIANYEAFAKAGKDWTVDELRATPESWKAHVESQKIPFKEDRSIYPSDTDFEEKWPAVLTTMEGGNNEELWSDYSGERGWPDKIDPNEDKKEAYKIQQQLYAAMVCFLLTAIALFFLIRTKGRVMKVDAKGYYPPGGELIPFSKITTIDKRKWDVKGLATLIYNNDAGEEKKAKVDGMVYGQFKEEDGAPAEALFQTILNNFEGELIDLVFEDEDEEEAVSEGVESPGEVGKE